MSAITVEEALRRLAESVPPPIEEVVPLDRALAGFLAKDAVSDVDMPPFDRAMMDGYAVLASDTPGTFEIIEEIPAGHVPQKTVRSGHCSKIMTGAPLPPGADAVQQFEKTRPLSPTHVEVKAVTTGQNVTPRAQELKKGDVILHRGQPLRPLEIAVLASIGRTDVRTYRRPHCAMFATGNELVDPPAVPGPGQIRNSNAYSIAAHVRELGLTCDVLPIARDHHEELRHRIREGVTRDVLLMSGGVSTGEWDLVVPALEAEGFTSVVHHVLLRPGRPFYFGRRGERIVFGLPGNPISNFVTFLVFVRPFLWSMMGGASPRVTTVRVQLLCDLPKKTERTQYLPARLESEGVETLSWHGSADIFALTRANALAIQPIDTPLRRGDIVDVLLL